VATTVKAVTVATATGITAGAMVVSLRLRIVFMPVESTNWTKLRSYSIPLKFRLD
jgi:hypothetical protein